jgi:hypothetical protein
VTDADAVLNRIDNALGNCVCGEPLTLDGSSLYYCSEDCQEEWLRLRRTYNLPGRVALRRAAASIQITTRVMWTPGDPTSLAQGVDLTPHLTAIHVGDLTVSADPEAHRLREGPVPPQYVWDDHDYSNAEGSQQ